ncbi:MAG TPA: PsiF family protein [Burkholderiales bacterium]|nr:PsiF family protein [Burkholderiales bacterium]
MKLFIAALGLAFAASGAWAQDAKKEPTAAQKKQQERMKACNDKAGDKKGDARKSFMSACLKGEDAAATPAQKAQQARMSACNKQATEKKLKGDDRKKFMSSCLKG